MGTGLSLKKISNVICSHESSLKGTYPEVYERKERYILKEWLEKNEPSLEKVTFP